MMLVGWEKYQLTPNFFSNREKHGNPISVVSECDSFSALRFVQSTDRRPFGPEIQENSGLASM